MDDDHFCRPKIWLLPINQDSDDEDNYDEENEEVAFQVDSNLEQEENELLEEWVECDQMKTKLRY